MKLKALVAALAFSLTSGAANAIVVNYSGSDVNMGPVAVGQTGTISNYWSVVPGNFGVTPPPYIITGKVFGTLPTLSKITFSYTLPDSLIGGSVASNGSYGPDTYNGAYGFGTYSGYSSANSGTPGTTDKGFMNGNPSLPLVWAVANINGVLTATTSIQNNNTNHATTTTFASLFNGALSALPRNIGKITYSVSAVPLPAALPLFGAAIAGMFGFARLRRKVIAA